jgi:hypothetical protein
MDKAPIHNAIGDMETNIMPMEDTPLKGGDDDDSATLISVDDKVLLKEAITKWVNNDNDIRELMMELAKRKKLNKEYTQNLMKLIKKTEIETVDINNGSISYVQRNQKKAITNKWLNDVFIKYYNGNMEQVNQIINFMMEHREISVKEIIVRKIRNI